MKCYHCGTEVPEEGARFCPACGADMINTQEGETTVLNMDTYNSMYGQQTNDQSVPDTQPLNYQSAPQYADPSANQYGDPYNQNQPVAPNYPPNAQQPVSPQPVKAKKKKGKIILISVLIFLIALLGTVAALFFTSPAYKFSGKIEDGKYTEAVKLYNEKIDNKSLQESIAKLLVKGQASKVINDAFAKYQAGQLTGTEYDSIVAVFVDLDLANPPANPTPNNTPVVPNTPVIPEIPDNDIPAFDGDMDDDYFYEEPTYGYYEEPTDYYYDEPADTEADGLERFINQYAYDYQNEIKAEFKEYSGETTVFCQININSIGRVTLTISSDDFGWENNTQTHDWLEEFYYNSVAIENLSRELNMYNGYIGMNVKFVDDYNEYFTLLTY